KQRAQERPKADDVRRFCKVLNEELSPWWQRFGTKLDVRPISPPSQSPWLGVELCQPATEQSTRLSPIDWEGLLQAAHETATSEVFLHEAGDGLLVGRLAQQRYWSNTQARLLAQRIIWGHLDVLKGRASA
ncbi:MAG: HsdM family class I SAM-dependent methyltransferase, partial [Rhizomicrobium sp.]